MIAICFFVKGVNTQGCWSMSTNSNKNGRAFEFAILDAFERKSFHKVNAKIIENSSYEVSKTAWNSISLELQNNMRKSAELAVKSLLELEPSLLDNFTEHIEFSIQADNIGRTGDVRDILIRRSEDGWEIGISAKHNHKAVKHSRLGSTLDFGEKWFGIKCSNKYWAQVDPIFSILQKEKDKGTLWKDLKSKTDKVYVPLLTAFIEEIKRSYKAHPSSVPSKIVEYLVGHYDYYKVISADKKRCVSIMTFNLKGTLAKPGKQKKALMLIPVTKLPKRIINIGFKPGSKTTVEVFFDNGWSFSFRLHNASKTVEPSLKFDVNFIGHPSSVITIEIKWL